MIYLLTHIIIGKHYNNFITQFIIGTIVYIVFYLLSKEFINNTTYNENKYYLYSLIVIDISFLLYRSKITKKYFNKNESVVNINLTEMDTLTLSSIHDLNKLSQSNHSIQLNQLNQLNEFELDVSDFKIDHEIRDDADRNSNSEINLSASITDIFEKN